jgi:hypothetical protein
MVVLGLQDPHQLVTPLLQVPEPPIENDFLLEHSYSPLLITPDLSVLPGPPAEQAVEPLDVPGPLEVFNPELPLLEAPVPLSQGLLAQVDRVDVGHRRLELPMHETLPPLGEEDGEGFGLEHSLEDELADSGGEAVLDVVREAREGLLIHNVMRVGPETHHEMVMVR